MEDSWEQIEYIASFSFTKCAWPRKFINFEAMKLRIFYEGAEFMSRLGPLAEFISKKGNSGDSEM